MKSHQQRGLAPGTSAAKAEQRRLTKVILFDIDGTLVLTGGAGVRGMSRAFEELFSIADAFGDVQMAGRTDASILAAAAARHAIAESDLHRFHDVYLGHLIRGIDEPGPRKGVMPGIRPLLDTLHARDDAYLALLTGNIHRAARVKLEYFDLWRYFQTGAFGDHEPERNRLLPEALKRIEESGGPVVSPTDVVVIGDTPLDVACAAASGARSIAVATGSHSVDDLEKSGADVVFRDLSDTQAVVDAIWRE